MERLALSWSRARARRSLRKCEEINLRSYDKSSYEEIKKCKYPPSKIALLDERTLSGATAPRPSGTEWSDGTERVNARAVTKRATRPSDTEWRARAEGKTVTQKTISGRQSHPRYRLRFFVDIKLFSMEGFPLPEQGGRQAAESGRFSFYFGRGW